jgi:hypothetical protein
MPDENMSKQISDSVAKVEDEVAVGEDLEFQMRWWKFEHAVWIFFALVLVLTLAGAFGRGPIAKAERIAKDGCIDVKYDRIQRTSVTVNFGPAAIRNGRIDLYVSGSLVKELGAQRVVPSPARATIGGDGLTFMFPTSTPPASVEFALEPTGPGLHHLLLRVAGLETVNLDIAVTP